MAKSTVLSVKLCVRVDARGSVTFAEALLPAQYRVIFPPVNTIHTL